MGASQTLRATEYYVDTPCSARAADGQAWHTDG